MGFAMKTLFIALVASYLATWCSGLSISRQKAMSHVQARRLHFGLSLIT